MGDERTDVKPPLFSSDNSPRNTPTPLVTLKLLEDTPPMTSSLTTCQVGAFVEFEKSKRTLAEPAFAFIESTKQKHALVTRK